jgi:hypothetical protein
MPDQPRNAVTVLGFLVVVLIPATAIVLLLSEVRWYHGFGVFYAALGSAEIAYLAVLVIADWAQRSAMPRLLP